MTAPTAPAIRTAPDSDARAQTPLPPPTGRLRRAFKHPRLMHYNRLAAAVLTINIAVAFTGHWDARTLSYAALANVALAVVVRNQYVINLLFRAATAVPPH